MSKNESTQPDANVILYLLSRLKIDSNVKKLLSLGMAIKIFRQPGLIGAKVVVRGKLF